MKIEEGQVWQYVNTVATIIEVTPKGYLITFEIDFEGFESTEVYTPNLVEKYFLKNFILIQK